MKDFISLKISIKNVNKSSNFEKKNLKTSRKKWRIQKSWKDFNLIVFNIIVRKTILSIILNMSDFGLVVVPVTACSGFGAEIKKKLARKFSKKKEKLYLDIYPFQKKIIQFFLEKISKKFRGWINRPNRVGKVNWISYSKQENRKS